MSDRVEIAAVLTRLLDNLSLTVSSQTGRTGADLRRQIGRVRADYLTLLANGGFGVALLTCFRVAEQANVKLASLAYVREQLIAEEPVGDIAAVIVQSGISFCLATEARMVSALTFVSRDDVELMMSRMKLAFDAARDKVADMSDSSVYRQLTYLAGALTNHLATKSRPLPSMVTFKMQANLPSLVFSQRVYYEASRADELAQENRIIHPAFCLRDMRGLGA